MPTRDRASISANSNRPEYSSLRKSLVDVGVYPTHSDMCMRRRPGRPLTFHSMTLRLGGRKRFFVLVASQACFSAMYWPTVGRSALIACRSSSRSASSRDSGASCDSNNLLTSSNIVGWVGGDVLSKERSWKDRTN